LIKEKNKRKEEEGENIEKEVRAKRK